MEEMAITGGQCPDTNEICSKTVITLEIEIVDTFIMRTGEEITRSGYGNSNLFNCWEKWDLRDDNRIGLSVFYDETRMYVLVIFFSILRWKLKSDVLIIIFQQEKSDEI